MDTLPVRGNTILTLSRAATSIVAANVVIYAVGHGGRWYDQLGPQYHGLQGERMLVVDVDDKFDRNVENEVVCRASDYVDRGWRFFGQQPEKA